MGEDRRELQQDVADRSAALTGEARFGVDRDGTLVYWASTSASGLGPPPAHIGDLIVEPDPSRLVHVLEAAGYGGTVLLDVELRSPAGLVAARCTLEPADEQGVVHAELRPPQGETTTWTGDERDALAVASHVMADVAGGRPLSEVLARLGRYLRADRVALLSAHPSQAPFAVWPPGDADRLPPPRLLAHWLPRLRLDQVVHVTDRASMSIAAVEEAQLLAARGVRTLLAVPAVPTGAPLEAVLLVEADSTTRWGPWVPALARVVGSVAHGELVRRGDALARAGAAERLEVVMRHSASVLLVLDDAGAVAFVSSSLRRVLGWTPDQWTGRPLARLVHPRDRHLLERLLAPSQDGSASIVDVRVPDEHARWRWMSVGLGGHVDDVYQTGRVVHLHDVTDRVRLEGEERRLLEMVAATPDFVGTFTPQGVLVSVNAAGLSMIGLFEEEAVGLPLSGLFPDWTRKTLTGTAIPAACAHGSWTGETAVMHADGREIPVSQVVIAHRDSAGDVVFLSTMMRDVSEQRAAEQLLRRHTLQLLTVAELGQRALRQQDRERLLREVLLGARSMFDADHVLYVEAGAPGALEVRMHDSEGDIRLVGLPEPLHSLLEAPQPVVLPHLDAGVAPPALRAVVQGSAAAAYAVVRGAQRPAGILLVLSEDPAGLTEDDTHALDSLAGLLSTAIDRFDGDARLRQAERLEAVGRLAGGIAHDFNNLLTVILGNAEGLEGDAARAGEEITRAGTSAARLVEQLLTFSRGKASNDEVADLRALVLEFEPLLRRVIREDVELSVRVCDSGCPVRAAPYQLEQMLMNLVVNARDAMPQGGRIDILLERFGEPAVARLAVRDTGHGMEEAVRGRIFEPYYSTKGDDGSGLGLATVHSLVSGAGGNVTVDSTPGVGTTFLVELPTDERRQRPRPGPAEPAAAAPHGSARVLVVEDQAAIRSLVVESLRREGLDVVEAVNGVAAERVAQEHAWLDLVLTDIVMPERNGPALMEVLRRRWPTLPVIYMSGYSGDEVPVGDERVGFLQKPFSLSDVRETVWRFLGGNE